MHIPREQITPALQDEFDLQRTLHDAELITRGARFQNGRLNITGNLYEKLHSQAEADQLETELGGAVVYLYPDEMEQAAAAIVARKTETDKILDKTTGDLENEIKNRDSLGKAIVASTLGYTTMFTAMVARTGDGEKNHFGKLKEGVLEHVEFRTKPAQVTEIPGVVTEIERDFRITVGYEQEPHQNIAVEAEVLARGTDKRPANSRSPYEGKWWGAQEAYSKIKLESGLITHVGISSGAIGGSLFNKGLISQYDFPSNLAKTHPNGVWFALTDNQPSMVLNNGGSYHCEYVYSSEDNNFALTSTSNPNPYHKKDLPQVISVKDYCHALQACLDFCPVRKTSTESKLAFSQLAPLLQVKWS